MPGIPVVIATNGYGLAVKAVTANAPTMTVATNGYGTPIVLSENGSPFVVEGAGTSYEPEAVAYFARWTVQPDNTRKGLLNTLIKSLKDSGAWAIRDAYHLPAAPDTQSAVLNLKSTSFPLTPIGSPTFVADRGFMGDGVSAHIGTGHDGVAPPNFQQNSCSIMTWTNATASDVGNNLATIGKVTDVNSFIRPRIATTNLMTGRINGGATTSFGSALATRLGHRAMSRTGTSLSRAFVNGTQVGADDTQQSQTLISEQFLYLRLQNTYATDRLAAGALGGGLTPAQIAAEYTAFNTYLSTIGAA